MKCNLRQFPLNSSCVYPRNVCPLKYSEFLHFLNHVCDVVISIFSTGPVLYGNDIQYGFDICFCKTKVSKEFSPTSRYSGDLRFYGKIFQIFNTLVLFCFSLVFACFVFLFGFIGKTKEFSWTLRHIS